MVLLALALMMGRARPALGYGVLFTTDLMGQGYQVRDASGRYLNLRRVDANIRLYVYDILPEPEDEVKRRKPHPQMYMVTALRLESDFGSFVGAAGQGSSNLYEEMPTRPALNILFGYVGVTGLLGGYLELKLGRQFVWDSMDAYFFDGLTAEVKTPWYVKVILWGGARVNGVLPIDSPILLMDGTSPVETPLRWAPAFGVALESVDFKYVKARLAYRRTFTGIKDANDAAPIYEYPDGTVSEGVPRWATSEEKLTGTVFVDLFNGKLSPYAGMAYSINLDRLSRTMVGMRSVLGRHTLSAEYGRYEPDFDGDSIWNVFNTEPFTEARLTYELAVTSYLSGYVRTGLRFFKGGDPESLTDAAHERKKTTVDPGAGLGVLLRTRRWKARADWSWQEGYGGRTLGMDLAVRHELLPDKLDLEGRATLIHWNDDLAEYLRGITAGFSFGATWRVHPRVAVHLIAEENFGEYYKSDFRIYGLMEMTWCHKGYCPAGNAEHY